MPTVNYDITLADDLCADINFPQIGLTYTDCNKQSIVVDFVNGEIPISQGTAFTETDNRPVGATCGATFSKDINQQGGYTTEEFITTRLKHERRNLKKNLMQ